MTSHATINKSQNPLAGVLLCCTAIPPEERGSIALIVQQMGGVHKLDLTSDVTHLIAGDTNTPKYKYVAKQRPDVKVVRPEWINAVRTSWMEGGDTDVASLEEQYKLPTFAGLRICVTGFDDAQQRTDLARAITANGAEYHGDLTKTVTHLVAAAPQGKKYEHALQWQTKIVSAEWIDDCLQRGMVLDESLYNPLVPVEKRGQGAFIRRTESLPNLGKRQRDDDPASDVMDFGRRKLRRTASAKLGSQSDGIWADIGSGRSGSTKIQRSEWIDQIQNDEDETENDGRLSKGEPGNESIPSFIRDLGLSNNREKTNSTGIFQSQYVMIFGFDQRKTAILREHLTGNNAVVVSSDDTSNPDVQSMITAIVPHDLPPDQLSKLKESTPILQGCRIVTEWWVERCLHRRILIDPVEDILSRPIPRFPIPEFSTETICPTSFKGVDLLHFSKLVKLLGAKYDESLNLNTTVLVCNTQSPNTEKLKYAIEHNINVVSADWIWDCIESWKKTGFNGFRLSHSPRAVSPGNPPSGYAETIQTEESNSFKEIIRRSEDQRQARSSSHATLSGRGRLELVTSKSSRPPSSGPGSRVLSFHAAESIKRASFHHEKRPRTARSLIQEDDDSIPEPLGDIPPEVNSPSKRSKSSSLPPELPKTPMSRQDSENRSHETQGADPPSTEATVPLASDNRSLQDERANAEALRDDIALLLAKKKTTIPTANEKKSSLRNRPLGRAVSNPSSLSALSRSSSQTAQHSHPIEEDLGAEHDSLGAKKKLEDILPSQILSYEEPDADVARERLMKRMGIDVAFDKKENGMRRVESIGLVKDSAIASRVGSRKRNMRKK